MQDLTQGQQRVLKAIGKLTLRHRGPATGAEIAAELNLKSEGTVREHANVLAEKGYLQPRKKNLSRRLLLSAKGFEAIQPKRKQ